MIRYRKFFLILIRFKRLVIVKFKELKKNNKLLFKKRMKRNKESLKAKETAFNS